MFEAWYENWWFEHDVDKPAMSPKEAMRQAWEAGRKANKRLHWTLLTVAPTVLFVMVIISRLRVRVTSLRNARKASR